MSSCIVITFWPTFLEIQLKFVLHLNGNLANVMYSRQYIIHINIICAQVCRSSQEVTTQYTPHSLQLEQRPLFDYTLGLLHQSYITFKSLTGRVNTCLSHYSDTLMGMGNEGSLSGPSSVKLWTKFCWETLNSGIHVDGDVTLIPKHCCKLQKKVHSFGWILHSATV